MSAWSSDNDRGLTETVETHFRETLLLNSQCPEASIDVTGTGGLLRRAPGPIKEPRV